jgi:cytochrome c nitrite reductase small subunit
MRFFHEPGSVVVAAGAWTAGCGSRRSPLFGAFLGMLFYVARISEAASYLSDDPAACINCHIMFPQYATWQHSSHGRVTNCNDCHVPHSSTLAKYYFKAKDGLRHSALFTLRRERQVIQAIPESREVIQENCIRCHARVVEEIADQGEGASATGGGHGRGAFERACIDCHREVPHGRIHSLSSTPNAAVPPLSPVTPEWMRRGAPPEMARNGDARTAGAGHPDRAPTVRTSSPMSQNIETPPTAPPTPPSRALLGWTVFLGSALGIVVLGLLASSIWSGAGSAARPPCR